MVIQAGGASQRRLLEDNLKRFSAGGLADSSRFSGEDWQTLMAEARTGGLFSGGQVFIVEEAARLGPFPEQLEYCLEGEEAVSHCLLLFEKDHKPMFSVSALKSLEVIRPEKAPHWESGRVAWLKKIAADKNVRCTQGALHLMAEWIEDEEEQRSEMEKLALACEDGLVDEDLVRKLTVDEGAREMLTLLDGLCRADAPAAISALVFLRKREELLRITGALYNRLRLAMYMASLPSTSSEEMLGILGARKYQQKMAGEASRRFSQRALQLCVKGLVEVSIALKTGRDNGWNRLEMAVLGLLDEVKR